MRIKLLFWLLAAVVWFWFGHYWYTCRQLHVCYGCADKQEVKKPEKKRIPLDFKWSDATAFQNEGFSEFYQSILKGKTDDNILEITGRYFEGEENTSDYENMGLARAHNLKEVFLKDVPDERIKLFGEKVAESEGAKEGYFESAVFKWIGKPKPEPVEVLADKAIIRFPFNSTRKDADPKIDEYLSKLAKQLKETGGKVVLTGHTDNIGNHEMNYALGMRRAKIVRDILRKKGVKRSQIVTKSKGETEPVSSNDTDEGRHNNRRTEIKFIK